MFENTSCAGARRQTQSHQRLYELVQSWLQSSDLRNTLKTLAGV